MSDMRESACRACRPAWKHPGSAENQSVHIDSHSLWARTDRDMPDQEQIYGKIEVEAVTSHHSIYLLHNIRRMVDHKKPNLTWISYL